MLNQELQRNIRAAAGILQRGGVVVFPTETVYGLGADAANPQALRRVSDITKRPADQPLIVHIGHVSLLDFWASGIPDGAWRLATHFWPGPLTLILPRRAHVSRSVSCGQGTVGLRVPDHPVALALLRDMGDDKGLAATSASRFGRVSPTTAEHVRVGLGDSTDRILDGGPCRVGVESTIIGFDGAAPVLLRPGGIAVAALEAVLGQKISQPDAAPLPPHAQHSRLFRYTPAMPLEVWPVQSLRRRAWELATQGQRVAIMELTADPPSRPDSLRLFYYPMPAEATAYARVLYAILHNAAGARFDRILAEAPPQTADWQAVRDRLHHAATLYWPAAAPPREHARA